jgi:DNA-3-methyladenine glycosylase II
MTFIHQPQGPFSLAVQSQYFEEWLRLAGDTSSVVMAFPVEGWRTSAAAVMRQDGEGPLSGDVFGAGGDAARAWEQALATVSAEADGAAWPAVGVRDPILGRLQEAYAYLRPVLFYSPYEAAASFVIGHRISIQQTRAIRESMARALGDAIDVHGTVYHAFPRPHVLRHLDAHPGLSSEKIVRLQGIAEAALDGLLDRAYLRSLVPDDALRQLCALRGVGDFFAQGILFRGAGLVDGVTDEDTTKQAVKQAYGLADLPTHTAVLSLAEAWRPYRMWATVLLHVWLRREGGGPVRRRPARR